MSADPATLAFYEREALDYARWSAKHGTPGRLKTFAAVLRPGAQVLDLGCGAGWAARWLKGQGLAVTALDACAAFLPPLEAEGIATLHGDFLKLAAEAAFDGIWCEAALQHAPRKDIPAILKRIAAALRLGGVLHLSVHEGGTTLRDLEGRLYCEQDEAWLTATLTRCGLAVTGVSRTPSRGYDGRPITMLNLTARRI